VSPTEPTSALLRRKLDLGPKAYTSLPKEEGSPANYTVSAFAYIALRLRKDLANAQSAVSKLTKLIQSGEGFTESQQKVCEKQLSQLQMYTREYLGLQELHHFPRLDPRFRAVSGHLMNKLGVLDWLLANLDIAIREGDVTAQLGRISKFLGQIGVLMDLYFESESRTFFGWLKRSLSGFEVKGVESIAVNMVGGLTRLLETFPDDEARKAWVGRVYKPYTYPEDPLLDEELLPMYRREIANLTAPLNEMLRGAP